MFTNIARNQDRDTIFTYHPPTPEQQDLYKAIRAKAKELDELIGSAMPHCREQAVAFTKLEECVMWANAGIARRG